MNYVNFFFLQNNLKKIIIDSMIKHLSSTYRLLRVLFFKQVLFSIKQDRMDKTDTSKI